MDDAARARTAHSGDLLTAREAARRLRVRDHTLAVWRCGGEGPPFYRVGRSVRYSAADLDAYLAGRRVDPQAPTP